MIPEIRVRRQYSKQSAEQTSVSFFYNRLCAGQHTLFACSQYVPPFWPNGSIDVSITFNFEGVICRSTVDILLVYNFAKGAQPSLVFSIQDTLNLILEFTKALNAPTNSSGHRGQIKVIQLQDDAISRRKSARGGSNENIKASFGGGAEFFQRPCHQEEAPTASTSPFSRVPLIAIIIITRGVRGRRFPRV